jgi:mannose-6-phosphate isomerase-like protein (cupin superfamily)
MKNSLGFLSLVAVAAAAAGGGSASGGSASSGGAAPPSPAARAFALRTLESERQKTGREWLEFLRVESLSMGVYHLKKGAEDQQTPHKQDEVYYVASGKAVLAVDGEDYPVGEGSVVFVRAQAKHRFHSIAQDLTTLVFFAPAETE